MKNIILCTLIGLFFSFGAFAQTMDTVFKSSVQEVMGLPVVGQETEIVSASKKAEKLFNTPLSASVITREQIEKAGCLSIPEALRLANGVIVREVTKGNYDIHIQGFDNIKPFRSQFALTESTSILVMIDGRPVYNFFQGGTFWETLPIDISDLEAIEIVRGASSALYGANAVTGVINLITSPAGKISLKARATVQYGSNESKIFHAYISSRLSSKWALGFSANQQYRKRDSDKYYRFAVDRFVPLDSVLFGGNTTTNKFRYPDVNQALDRKAANFWIDFFPTNRLEMRLKGGWQNSSVQKMYVSNAITPLTTNTSNTAYLDYTAKGYGFSAQVSYNGGQQNVQGVTGWRYNFQTIFSNLEYEWQKNNFSVRAGLNYQGTTYDDKPGFDEFGRSFLGAEPRNLNMLAAFVRSEYTWKWFKIMGAIRAEHYNSPDKNYYPYQIALTYQPSETWLFRIVNARANQGAFMLDNFYKTTAATSLRGNTNLNLADLTINEMGIRKKLGKHIEIEAELFNQEIGNLAGFRQIILNTINSVSNYDFKAQQQGVNLRIEYKLAQSFQANLCFSFQKTMLRDFPITADYKKTDNIENKSLPSFYGSLYLNWQASPKLNLNTTAYYFGNQGISTLIAGNNSGTTGVKNLDTPAFAVFNVNATYAFYNSFKVVVNARNLNWGSKKQLFQVDGILPEVLLGVRFDL
jgi:iron complex outermembrane recepter protein